MQLGSLEKQFNFEPYIEMAFRLSEGLHFILYLLYLIYGLGHFHCALRQLSPKKCIVQKLTDHNGPYISSTKITEILIRMLQRSLQKFGLQPKFFTSTTDALSVLSQCLIQIALTNILET